MLSNHPRWSLQRQQELTEVSDGTVKVSTDCGGHGVAEKITLHIDIR